MKWMVEYNYKKNNKKVSDVIQIETETENDLDEVREQARKEIKQHYKRTATKITGVWMCEEVEEEEIVDPVNNWETENAFYECA